MMLMAATKISHAFERRILCSQFGPRRFFSGGLSPNAKYGKSENAPTPNDTSANGHAGQRKRSFGTRSVKKTSGKMPSELKTASMSGSTPSQSPMRSGPNSMPPEPEGAKKTAYAIIISQITRNAMRVTSIFLGFSLS